MLVMVGALLSLGLAVGFFAGLLGIGGGLLTVPALHFLLTHYGFDPNVTVHTAIGTSMAVIIPTGIKSARAHATKGAVDRDIFYQMIWGILAGVLLGAMLAHVMDAKGMKIVFGFVAILVAVIMALDPAKYRLADKMPSFTVNTIVGTVFGICASLMGVAGGAMNVPYMTLHGIQIHKAVGTAAALGVVLSIPAMIGYMYIGYGLPGLPPFSIGYVNFGLAALILPGSIFTAPYGAALAHRLPVKRLRQFFAVFIMIVALKMIF